MWSFVYLNLLLIISVVKIKLFIIYKVYQVTEVHKSSPTEFDYLWKYIICVVGPIIEEYIFRYILPYVLIAQIVHDEYHICIYTNILFALSHVQNCTIIHENRKLLIISQVITTFFLGIIIMSSQSFIIGIIYHIYYNYMMTLIYEKMTTTYIDNESDNKLTLNLLLPSRSYSQPLNENEHEQDFDEKVTFKITHEKLIELGWDKI